AGGARASGVGGRPWPAVDRPEVSGGLVVVGTQAARLLKVLRRLKQLALRLTGAPEKVPRREQRRVQANGGLEFLFRLFVFFLQGDGQASRNMSLGQVANEVQGLAECFVCPL